MWGDNFTLLSKKKRYVSPYWMGAGKSHQDYNLVLLQFFIENAFTLCILGSKNMSCIDLIYGAMEFPQIH